jgi:type IV secretory pathway VirB2 component (pilin)
MKNTMKVMSVLVIIAMLLFALSTVVSASGAAGLIDKMNPDYSQGGDVANFGQKLTSIISTVAIVIAVIVLLILGIKYMIGSASEKAEYKKTMIPYLVGAVLVFGAGAIAKVVVNIASTITGA